MDKSLSSKSRVLDELQSMVDGMVRPKEKNASKPKSAEESDDEIVFIKEIQPATKKFVPNIQTVKTERKSLNDPEPPKVTEKTPSKTTPPKKRLLIRRKPTSPNKNPKIDDKVVRKAVRGKSEDRGDNT